MTAASARRRSGLREVLLASGNTGKAREFERLLGGVISVCPLPPQIVLPEEIGATFTDNARLKAEAVFQQTGGRVAVLADDSGLEVEALAGQPGVHSARYAGEGATDEENVAQLLMALHGTSQRQARFICCLCLLVPQPGPGVALCIEVSGETAGAIEAAPRGKDGFGYDPVFRPDGWEKTLAEAGPAGKDSVSHRGAAMRALLETLQERGLLTHD